MSWIKYAKPGDKVVCVYVHPNMRSWASKFQNVKLLELGRVYTIRNINAWSEDRILICVEELDNSHLVGLCGEIEPGFPHIAFQPVQPRKTSISIFQEMLNKAPAKTLEEV